MSPRNTSAGLVRLGFAALIAASLLVACGSHAAPRTSTVATCPLTGELPPGGRVPTRPALAVKVENLPSARPQYGLDAADVVYEEPVEGGITRFIAIYQCRDTSRIEPIRSGRFIDPEIVSQFGTHPLFAYAGAIPAVVAAVDSSSLVDIGINRAPADAYSRDSARVAPHNLMSSTAALYAAGLREGAPQVAPPPVFTFGALTDPARRSATQVHIPYQYSNLTWTWQPGQQLWARSYADTGPATLGGGGRIAAANVVVMKVVLYPSPYVDENGVHQNLLTLTGSGPVQVFRNGSVVNGTWNRPSLGDITRFLDPTGGAIPLSPGPTWIELVPTTIAVTVTP